jgi:hypothetical protein
MTTPAIYAEGLRVLWLLASRGVSATWDGTTVAVEPPDPAADGAIEALEAVLRLDADGRSYLQLVRERHAPFLREVKAAKPEDVDARQWRRAIEGLESFLLSGWGDEALRLGWSDDELFCVPKLWSQIHLCGAALAIGDREVVNISATEIRIKTTSGATLAFYRRPEIDYRLVYTERLKRFGLDASKEEFQLRAREHAVNVCRANTGSGLEEAKTAVLNAIASKAERRDRNRKMDPARRSSQGLDLR